MLSLSFRRSVIAPAIGFMRNIIPLKQGDAFQAKNFPHQSIDKVYELG